VQKLANCLEVPPDGAELPPVGAELPPVAAGVVEVEDGVLEVVLGAEPPVGAELPPASPGLELVDDDEPVPVVSDVDDESVELESLDELRSLELPESELVESPVVPVAVPSEVVPVDVPDEFSSLARLAEAVGSTRSGIVRGTESETEAPPQAVRASPASRLPRSAAGRARLGNASPRLDPCAARRSGSR
jgi:hypothetical protein